MRVIQLEGLDDSRFVDRDLYRDIGHHERLRARGLFVAEGRLVVTRLLERHSCLMRSMLVNAAAHRALEASCAGVGDEVTAFVCDARDFEMLTGYDIHRGCLALASRLAARSLDDVISAARLLVLVEEVANADNVGSVFRNAAAFGVDAIVLSHGCADPLYRKTIRTSMAAALSVPYVIAPRDGWRATLDTIGRCGFQLVALTPDPSAQDLDAFAHRPDPGRVALLVGSEGAGLTPVSLAAADARVRIPIHSAVDSLNVAVATGIALHQLAGLISREQQAGGNGEIRQH
jgi:tRNA G18 (ribose-2'-O)-methylase SpoU